ncbi:relaxase/mobilization nuclease domain-containing protein [Halodesulfovibrio sp. MK-HDV]|uniref:relaxase/mobilization nuclease domain-containing protein n=1 Tax=Halodesulfovibrio sp. MK-HDV TaxID=2599925 RepID=UPI00136F9EDC|nr:relaxase/mobilization nuclease domain-containing protein [Halodesulfovibrio sp. MK-HDV]KAF1073931.1 DNA relaxase MbeA [Halodesulfovibrio sp. MK-HDV]
MLMKVFKHGIGRGEKVIGYVTDSNVEKRKHSPPKILRGDPDQVKRLIDTTSRKWRYTSGVLSWAPEDNVTPEKEKELMDSFEQHAFAGIEPDQYSILWVRHSHTTHHELHFVIPRTELRSDKALNPCPPGWDKQYNPWCELWNRRNNWARPDELKRTRLVSPGASIGSYCDSTAAEIRTSLTESLMQGVEAGLIKNRTDIITALKQVGFTVPRRGKDYLTIEIPSDSQTALQKKKKTNTPKRSSLCKIMERRKTAD